MKVDSQGSVTDLDSDELDAKSAEEFLPAVAVGTVGGTGAGDEARTRDILLGRKSPLSS